MMIETAKLLHFDTVWMALTFIQSHREVKTLVYIFWKNSQSTRMKSHMKFSMLPWLIRLLKLCLDFFCTSNIHVYLIGFWTNSIFGLPSYLESKSAHIISSSVCLFLSLSVCVCVCVCVSLFVSLSVCLSVCLFRYIRYMYDDQCL